MIKCETCGVTFIQGTLFCADCGAQLYCNGKNDAAERWHRAHFLLPASGRKQNFSLSPSNPVVIGRADPEDGYWPQLDLTLDGGVEKGVSRCHAVVQLNANEPVITDKGSVNGTWIGDVKLEPDRPYPLPVSGKLRFGSMDVFIFLE